MSDDVMVVRNVVRRSKEAPSRSNSRPSKEAPAASPAGTSTQSPWRSQSKDGVLFPNKKSSKNTFAEQFPRRSKEAPSFGPSAKQQDASGGRELVKRPSNESDASYGGLGHHVLVRRSSKESQQSAGGLTRKSSKESIEGGRKNVRDVILRRQSKNSGGKARVQSEAFIKSLDPKRFADRKFLDDMFIAFDPNGDGSGGLDYQEFHALCDEIGLQLSKKEVKALMTQLDLNGDGIIQMEEFHFFFNHAKDRTELKKHAKDMCGSKNLFVRKLFDEFKVPGKQGVNLEGLNSLCNVCSLSIDKESVKLLFETMDTKKTGYITHADLDFFFSNVESRQELTDLLGSIHQDNTIFLKKVFAAFDHRHAEALNEQDLHNATHFLGIELSPQGVCDLLKKIDADGSGEIELNEFLDFFGQVKNTEEMVDAINTFQAHEQRKKMIMQGSLFLSGLAFAICIIMQDPDDENSFLGILAILFMILFWLLFIPVVGMPMVVNCILPYFTKCSSRKLWGLAGLFVFADLGMVAYYLVADDSLKPVLLAAVGALTAIMFTFGCVGSTYNVASAAGWLAEPEDSSASDDDMVASLPKTVGKGPARYAPDGPDLEKGAPGPPKQAFK